MLYIFTKAKINLAKQKRFVYLPRHVEDGSQTYRPSCLLGFYPFE